MLTLSAGVTAQAEEVQLKVHVSAVHAFINDMVGMPGYPNTHYPMQDCREWAVRQCHCLALVHCLRWLRHCLCLAVLSSRWSTTPTEARRWLSSRCRNTPDCRIFVVSSSVEQARVFSLQVAARSLRTNDYEKLMTVKIAPLIQISFPSAAKTQNWFEHLLSAWSSVEIVDDLTGLPCL